MHAGEEKYLNLKEDVPVYIVYFTSWVDDQGAVHFRDDIYGHDKMLEKEYFN
jgi:murein L,D-transpeptidase YcbB/YkuD